MADKRWLELLAKGVEAWNAGRKLGERASYVRAVGQVEVIFALMISILFFRETSSRKELTGMALVVVGIVLLLTVG